MPNSLAASASAATFRAIVLAVACLAALSATWGGNQPLFAQEAAPRGVNSSDEADEAPAFDPRGPRVIIAPDDHAGETSAPAFDPRRSDDATPPAPPQPTEPAFPTPPPRGPMRVQPQTPPLDAGPAEIRSARDMLGLLGVDASHLEMFQDGEPIGLAEEDGLHKLLFAARRFPISRLEAMSYDTLNLNQLTAAPVAMRGEIFPVEGFVTEVIAHEPPTEIADRYQLSRYYECRLEMGQTDLPATIYTNHIPEAWPVGEAMRERVSAQGIFVKLAGDMQAASSQHPQPVFVAHRIAWHPDTFLGNLGMDVGLFDQVQQRKTLLSEDRECFYRLLHLAEQFDPARLREAVQQTQQQFAAAAAQREKPAAPGLGFIIGELLKDPAQYAGMPFELNGVLKRAIKVRVHDADIQERFGIDHYYELQVLLDLHYVIRDGDEEHHFNNYPITVCVRHLPPGIPEGERLREFVRVPAVLMKVWLYQSEFAAKLGETKSQTAPLFVGRTIGWQPAESATNPIAGWIAGGLFLLAIAGIWYGIWRYNRDDRTFRKLTSTLHQDDPDLRGLADLDRRRP